MSERHTEVTFESVIESHLLAHGNIAVDRKRANFSGILREFTHEARRH